MNNEYGSETLVKKNFFIKKIVFYKIAFNYFFKIDYITLDPGPNGANILNPDPNSMYLDPQH